jgi:hypothetical protein
MAQKPFAAHSGIEIIGEFNTQMINGSADPSQSPGIAAPASSCYTQSVLNADNITYTVTIYDKFGPNDTDWKARTSSNLLGTPTDGTYTDGLFQFTSTTKTGDAVDTINEFLSLMAPPAAPALSDLESTLTGATGKLSFDLSHPISGYSYDNAVAINTTISKSGNDLGIFNNSTTITGILNNNITANSSNAWPAKAFGPGDNGTLELFVNGTQVHSVDLSTFGSGATVTGGSGFSLSAATPVQFSNGNQFPALTYRTGTVAIAAAAQRPGYNYATVTQIISGVPQTTNMYYWYVDVDATAMTATATSLTPTMSGSRYLSGVQYYNSGSLRLQAAVHAAYQDVYSASSSAVMITSSQATFTSLSIPNTTSNTADLPVDVSANLLNSIRLLGVAPTASLSVLHPIKTTLTVSGITSTKVLYDPIVSSSDLVEDFNVETYRVSTVPSTAAAAPTAYDSTVSIFGSGDLQVYNGGLTYPKLDLRSVADGGMIDNAPLGNPNYTGASGTRTFIRVFQNNSGQTRANFKINITGASTTFVAAGATSGNNLSVEMKFPQGNLSAGTGWMDAYGDFATGQWSDGAGARSETLGAGRALSTDWGLTIGTQTIAIGERVYLRITAPATWTGSLYSITFTWL